MMQSEKAKQLLIYTMAFFLGSIVIQVASGIANEAVNFAFNPDGNSKGLNYPMLTFNGIVTTMIYGGGLVSLVMVLSRRLKLPKKSWLVSLAVGVLGFLTVFVNVMMSLHLNLNLPLAAIISLMTLVLFGTYYAVGLYLILGKSVADEKEMT